MSQPHIPVLLNEVLNSFKDQNLGTFVDGTLGAGGHAEAILTSHPEIKKYIGIDQDPVALEIAKQRLLPWKSQLVTVRGNFSEIEAILKDLDVELVDGMLLDLGVSSMQLDQPEKGFSFTKDGPLDMRMNPNATLTAEQIVNEWSEKELGQVFRDYGEEKRWRVAARTVVNAREAGRISTTFQLVDLLRPVLGRGSKKGIHPLTLIFQGLRICVNSELEHIKEIIPQAIRLLRKQGRLAIISFHSLEDRIVKQAFRYAASDKEDTSGFGGVFITKQKEGKIITRKPIVPKETEAFENPRSRSAKLRVIEKI